jgi:hypothetical protein
VNSRRVITRCITWPMSPPGASIRALPGDLEPLSSVDPGKGLPLDSLGSCAAAPGDAGRGALDERQDSFSSNDVPADRCLRTAPQRGRHAAGGGPAGRDSLLVTVSNKALR